MSKNKGVDWSGLVILFLFLGSFAGVIYSFRFLLSAIVFTIIYLSMLPRARKANEGLKALEQVEAWEKGLSQKPSESVFEKAADYYMYNYILDYRQEDMSGWEGISVPDGIKPYIKSAKELPYRCDVR